MTAAGGLDLGEESTRSVAVARPLVFEAACACGFPKVAFGRLTIEGEAGWGNVTALGAATPPERLALLRLLEDHLLQATEGARQRIAQDELPEAATASSPGGSGSVGTLCLCLGQDAEPDPVLFGDIEALDLVRKALALVPPAVRHAAVTECAWLAVGLSSRAWTGPSAFFVGDERRLTRVVVLGPAADVQTVLHEIGHVWHAGPPSDAALAPTASEPARRAAATAAGIDVAGELRRGEVLADALAACWLAPPPEAPGRDRDAPSPASRRWPGGRARERARHLDTGAHAAPGRDYPATGGEAARLAPTAPPPSFPQGRNDARAASPESQTLPHTVAAESWASRKAPEGLPRHEPPTNLPPCPPPSRS